MKFNKKGWEINDPNPIEVPVGFKKPETLNEQIQRLVRTEISEAADAHGMETFEDAEDFDIDDDIDPNSPFEMEFDPILGREVSADMIHRNQEEYKEEYIAKAVNHPEIEQEAEHEKKRYRFPWQRNPAEPEAADPSQKQGPQPPEELTEPSD